MRVVENTLSVVTPADKLPGPPQSQWTYNDYARLPEDGNQYEIIDGVIYQHPRRTFNHQQAIGNFIQYLCPFLETTGSGIVIMSLFDVILSAGNVVQPDILVVLNEHKDRIKYHALEGAPDLVVEVASPSTAGYDRRWKQDAYAAAGIPEYWIADPDSQTVELLVLDQGVYRSLGVFRGKAVLPSEIVKDFPVQVEQFFA